MSWDLLGKTILFCIAAVYAIVQFAHTFSFPISEDDMRRIIREELKKALDETKLRINK